MANYICTFAGETIDASEYAAIDFGVTYDLRYYSFDITDNGDLVVTRHYDTDSSITISNWNGHAFKFEGREYVVKQWDSQDATISNETMPVIYVGSNGNNNITITNGQRPVVFGLEGNDNITWNGNAKVRVAIDGGDGDDIITVNNGMTHLNAGTGNDIVYLHNLIHDQSESSIYGVKDSTICLGGGNDTITVTDSDYLKLAGDRSAADLKVLGDSDDFRNNHDTSTNDNNVDYGDDTIKLVNTDHSYVLGDAGNDSITLVSSDNNEVYGGTGNDTIINISSSSNTIYSESGTDVVTNIAGTANTVDAGADNDVVRSFNSQNENIKANVGNDIITIYGGTNTTMSGGAGDDTYKYLTKITENTHIVIDQSDAAEGDKDRLVLAKVSKSEVNYFTEKSNLIIMDKNGGKITVSDWKNHALTKVVFKDGVVTAQEINNNTYDISASYTEIAAGSSKVWSANEINNKAILQGYGINLTVLNFDANTVIDYAALDTDDPTLERVNNDLKYILENDDDDTLVSTITFKNYFAGSVYPHLNDGESDILVAVGTSGNDTVDLNKDLGLSANEAVIYFGAEGNDKISATSGRLYIDGGAGQDEITVNGGEGQVSGGIGSDIYNITWNLGDDINIDCRDYETGDLDYINILNCGSDEFIFTVDSDDNDLKLYDSEGGRLKIILGDAGFDAKNFQGINFKDGESLSVDEIVKKAKTTIEMHSSGITYAGTEDADTFYMTVDHDCGIFYYNIANLGDNDKITATSAMMEYFGTVTYGGFTQKGNDAWINVNSVIDGVDTQIGTIYVYDYFKNNSTRQLNFMGETYTLEGQANKNYTVDGTTALNTAFTATDNISDILAFSGTGWQAEVNNFNTEEDVLDFSSYTSGNYLLKISNGNSVDENNNTVYSNNANVEVVQVNDAGFTAVGKFTVNDIFSDVNAGKYLYLKYYQGGYLQNTNEYVGKYSSTISYYALGDINIDKLQINDANTRFALYGISNDLQVTVNGKNASLETGSGNDTIYVNSSNGCIGGQSGSDTYIIDWDKAENNSIYDYQHYHNNTAQDVNTVVLNNLNFADVSFLYNSENQKLTIKDTTNKYLNLCNWNSDTGYAIVFSQDNKTLDYAAISSIQKSTVIEAASAGVYDVDEDTEQIKFSGSDLGNIVIENYTSSVTLNFVSYAESNYMLSYTSSGNDVVLRVIDGNNTIGTITLLNYLQNGSKQIALEYAIDTNNNRGWTSTSISPSENPTTTVMSLGQPLNYASVSDVENAYVTGSKFADTVTMTGSNNSVHGNAGDDNITLSGANSSVSGGNGADNITVSGANSYVYGGDGVDTITVSGADSYVSGGDDSDNITVSNTAGVRVSGGAGDDTIIAKQLSEGTCQLNGNEGDDSITLENVAPNDGVLATFEANGNTGNDEFYVQGTYNSKIHLNGQDGVDTFTVIGKAEHTRLMGGAGDDIYVINWRDGDDIEVRNDSGIYDATTNSYSTSLLSNNNGDYIYDTLQENDSLTINDAAFTDFTYIYDVSADTMRLDHKNSGNVEITCWTTNKFSEINFSDGAKSYATIIGASTSVVSENSTVTWIAGSVNNTVSFAGGNATATIYNVNADTIIDISALVNAGQDDFIATRSGQNLIITTSQDSNNQSTLTFVGYFDNSVDLHFNEGSTYQKTWTVADIKKEVVWNSANKVDLNNATTVSGTTGVDIFTIAANASSSSFTIDNFSDDDIINLANVEGDYKLGFWRNGEAGTLDVYVKQFDAELGGYKEVYTISLTNYLANTNERKLQFNDQNVLVVGNANGATVADIAVSLEYSQYAFVGGSFTATMTGANANTVLNLLHYDTLQEQNLSFAQSGNDLVITMLDERNNNAVGTLTLQDYYISRPKVQVITDFLRTNELNIGTAGNDTITLNYSNGNAATGINGIAFGGAGVDTITSTAGNNFIYGGDGGDIITIAGDGNTVHAEGGNGSDKFYLNAGVSYVYGDAGGDEFYITNPSSSDDYEHTTVTGGEGSDTYNVTWQLGDTLTIDNTTDDGNLDKLYITGDGITKDSFTNYSYDSATGILTLTDSSNGSLTILFNKNSDNVVYNFDKFSIGGENITAQGLRTLVELTNGYQVDFTNGISKQIVDCATMELNQAVAIKGLGSSMSDLLTYINESGNLVITNADKTKFVELKNLDTMSVTEQKYLVNNIVLYEDGGYAHICHANGHSSETYDNAGVGYDRYILAGNNFDLTLNYGVKLNRNTLLDNMPVGDAVPCYKQDGKDLVLEYVGKDGYLGAVTLKGYYDNTTNYANVYGLDGDKHATIPSLLSADIMPVGFGKEQTTLTVDAFKVNKSALTIAGLGTSLANYSASMDGTTLVLTYGDKTIRLENIAASTFDFIEGFGYSTDAAVINSANNYSITNASADTCFNRYYFTTTGWTLNVDFAKDKDIDSSVVMDVANLLAQNNNADIVATKLNDDFKLELVDGSSVIGTILVKGYFATDKAGLYSTIDIKADNTSDLKKLNAFTYFENDVIHVANTSATITVADNGSNVTIYGGINYTINGGVGKDEITLADETGYVGNANKVNAGAGDDVINVQGGIGHVVDSGEGRDTVTVSSGTSHTINTGSGIDTINISGGTQHIINAGADADIINITEGSVASIASGAGIDTITVNGGTVTIIDGGEGNDNITITGGSVDAISSGADGDTITVTGGSVGNINADAGDDIITVNADNVTSITGGVGSDTYNITWKLGDTLTLDNTSSDSALDKVYITGEDITKDNFTYNFDATTAYLHLKDSSGGKLSVKLTMQGATPVFNFSEFSIGGEALTFAETQIKTISFAESKNIAFTADDLEGITTLDVSSLGEALPCYTKSGNDLVLTYEGRDTVFGTVTLKDYYATDVTYAEIYLKGSDSQVTISGLLNADYLPVGFAADSTTLTIDASSVSKTSMTIAGLGADLSTYNSSMDNGTLVLTNGTKTVRLENIANAGFKYIEGFGYSTDAAVINSNGTVNITNENADSCFNRYYFTTTGWTLNVDFAKDKDIDSSVVMDVANLLAQNNNAEITATKLNDDFQLEFVDGTSVIGTILVKDYFATDKAGLYNTIDIKADNTTALKGLAEHSYFENDVIHAANTTGEITVADNGSSVTLYGGTNYTINGGAGKDEITLADKIGYTGNANKVNAGAGDDVINIQGGIGHTVTGGAGSDTYNITWKLGNKLTIDNVSSDSSLDKLYITGDSITKDSFTYSYDSATGVLSLKDDNNGVLNIKFSINDGDAVYNFETFKIGNDVLGNVIYSNNNIVIDDGSYETVYGAQSTNANVYNNDVILSGGSTELVYGGYSVNGDVYNNNVTLDGYVPTGNVKIYGGYSENGQSYNNTVTINNVDLSNSGAEIVLNGSAAGEDDITISAKKLGNITGTIILGQNTGDEVIISSTKNYYSGNEIIIADGNNAGDIKAALGAGQGISSCSVNVIYGGVENVYAAYDQYSYNGKGLEYNNVTIGAYGSATNVYGAYISGETDVRYNTAYINGGVVSGAVYGSYSGTRSSVYRNGVYMTDGVVGDLIGAYVSGYDAEVTENFVSMTGGEANNVYGVSAHGTTLNFECDYNTTLISNAKINNNVYGLYWVYNVGTHNTLTITDSTIGDNVYGYYTTYGSSAKGTVKISGNTHIFGSVYGAYGPSTKISNIEIEGNVFVDGDVYGAKAEGGSSDNTSISIAGDVEINGTVYGAAKSDTIVINGGTINSIDGLAGADSITISDGSVNSITGGDGDDIITINGGSIETIFGGDGGDSINVSSGLITSIAGGEGSDKYNIIWTEGNSLTIDNTDYVSGDVDSLAITNMAKSDFASITFDESSKILTLTDNSNGVLTVRLRNSLLNKDNFTGITFKDGTFVAKADLVERETILPANTTDYTWTPTSLNNTLRFAGGSNNVHINNDETSSATIIDLTNIQTAGVDFVTERYGTDLKIKTSYNDVESTLILDRYFSNPVGVHFIVDGNPYAVVLAGDSSSENIPVTSGYKSIFDAGYKLFYLAGNGDDTFTATGGSYYLNGEWHADVFNLSGTMEDNVVIGGQGSDVYNITWTQGNKLTIDNSDYSTDDVDTINIIGAVSTDFAYAISGEENNSVLTLTEKNGGGKIEIKLAADLLNSANFTGINFKQDATSDATTMSVEDISDAIYGETLVTGAVLDTRTGKLTIDATYTEEEVNFDDSRIVDIDASNGGFVQNIYGNGNDNTIYASNVSSWDTEIHGGSGNDTIYTNSHGSYTTYVYGENGDDKISLASGKECIYWNGTENDGSDSIYNFDHANGDILNMANASTMSYVIKGENIIIVSADGMHLNLMGANNESTKNYLNELGLSESDESINIGESCYLNIITGKLILNGQLSQEVLSDKRIKDIESRYKYLSTLYGNSNANIITGSIGTLMHANIYAGSGDDIIYTWGATQDFNIYGEAGNDTIHIVNRGSGIAGVIIHWDGSVNDGNDVVYGLREYLGDKLVLTNTETLKYTEYDNKLVITSENGTTLTLIDYEFNSSLTSEYGVYQDTAFETLEQGAILNTITGVLRITDDYNKNIINFNNELIKTIQCDDNAHTIIQEADYGYRSIHCGATDDNVTAYSEASISGGDGNDTIISYANCSISGGSGDDSITSYANNDISADAGNNSIYLYGSNETVTWYGYGNDVLTGFALNKGDTLSYIPSGSTIYEEDGSNIVITSNSNTTLTIVGGNTAEVKYYLNNLDLHIVDAITGTIKFDATSVASEVRYDSNTKVKNIDATGNTTITSIYSNDDSNSIIGSSSTSGCSIYAGDGNDTIETHSFGWSTSYIDGGYGDDIIYLKGGKESIIWSGKADEGSDVVYGFDYAGGDRLGYSYSSYYNLSYKVSGNDIIISSQNDTSLTLKESNNQSVKQYLSGRGISGVCDIYGSDADDKIYSYGNGDVASIIDGKGGNDTIYLRGGKECLEWTGSTVDGNDTVYGFNYSKGDELLLTDPTSMSYSKYWDKDEEEYSLIITSKNGTKLTIDVGDEWDSTLETYVKGLLSGTQTASSTSSASVSTASMAATDSHYSSVVAASMSFADDASTATSFVTTEENEEQKLKISGNVA